MRRGRRYIRESMHALALRNDDKNPISHTGRVGLLEAMQNNAEFAYFRMLRGDVHREWFGEYKRRNAMLERAFKIMARENIPIEDRPVFSAMTSEFIYPSGERKDAARCDEELQEGHRNFKMAMEARGSTCDWGCTYHGPWANHTTEVCRELLKKGTGQYSGICMD